MSDATEDAVKRGHLYQLMWLQYGHACLICDIYIIDVARRETCHDYSGKSSTIPQPHEDWCWSWTSLTGLRPTLRRPTRSLHRHSTGYRLDPEKSLYLTLHQPGFPIRYGTRREFIGCPMPVDKPFPLESLPSRVRQAILS